MDKKQLIEQMIFILKYGFANCFCLAYERATNRFTMNTEMAMIERIPELKKYKPRYIEIKARNGYWFDKSDTKKRIEILENILKEIKK